MQMGRGVGRREDVFVGSDFHGLNFLTNDKGGTKHAVSFVHPNVGQEGSEEK